MEPGGLGLTVYNELGGNCCEKDDNEHVVKDVDTLIFRRQ